MDIVTTRSKPGLTIIKPAARLSAQRQYVILTVGLALFIAIVSPFRSEMQDADAWEHHRAIKALVDENFAPGNPTYASDEPSVRYSPYSVALATICRATGIDAYTILTIAGVASWLLLCGGIWWLLRTFQEETAGPYVLAFLVLFYGVAPGYANSFALSDLPWHQVNPSAFSMALNFIAWALFRSNSSLHGPRRARYLAWSIAAIAVAVSTLSHGMSGFFGAVGIALLPWSVNREHRWLLCGGVAVIGLISFTLCWLWPWYDFLGAMLNDQDKLYWFNPIISRRMLFLWCLPSYLVLLAVLPLRDRPLVRWCLVMALVALSLNLLAWAFKSPTLARLPLAALPLLHVALGVWAREVQLFSFSKLPNRARELLSKTVARNAEAVLVVLVWVMFIYALVPQALDIATQPYLARPILAKLAGKEDKQPRIVERYSQVLKNVTSQDVILATKETGWPAPSFGGRIVAASHFELFSPRQSERQQDVSRFFATTDYRERHAIIQKYDVDYLLIDTSQPENALVQPGAVVTSAENLVLMDAAAWLAAVAPTGESPGNQWSGSTASEPLAVRD